MAKECSDACWCGVVKPFFSAVRGHCGGMGEIDCFCGGDLCVCHNHGSVECPGCPECEEADDDNHP